MNSVEVSYVVRARSHMDSGQAVFKTVFTAVVAPIADVETPTRHLVLVPGPVTANPSGPHVGVFIWLDGPRSST